MNQYKIMFWVLFAMVCTAIIADLDASWGTFRHAVALAVPTLFFGALAIAGIGYVALAYVFWADARRCSKMTKAELEREYLARVAGVSRHETPEVMKQRMLRGWL
jgi:hypothetical protein